MVGEASNANAKDLRICTAFKEHSAIVRGLIERMIGPDPFVDDLVQETFLIALIKQGNLRKKSALRTWLCGIALNLCRHQFRRNKRQKKLLDKMSRTAAKYPRTPEEVMATTQELAYAKNRARKLSTKQREVFVFHELFELEGQEIADALNIPIGTVWSRLHHARKVMKIYHKNKSE